MDNPSNTTCDVKIATQLEPKGNVEYATLFRVIFARFTLLLMSLLAVRYVLSGATTETQTIDYAIGLLLVPGIPILLVCSLIFPMDLFFGIQMTDFYSAIELIGLFFAILCSAVTVAGFASVARYYGIPLEYRSRV